MSASSPSPQPDHVRAALGNASTFRAITWNLKLSVQVSLAVGPSVSGMPAQDEQEEGRGFSTDIGARGGVAAGLEKYFVSHDLVTARVEELSESSICRCNAHGIPTSLYSCPNCRTILCIQCWLPMSSNRLHHLSETGGSRLIKVGMTTMLMATGRCANGKSGPLEIWSYLRPDLTTFLTPQVLVPRPPPSVTVHQPTL